MLESTESKSREGQNCTLNDVFGNSSCSCFGYYDCPVHRSKPIAIAFVRLNGVIRNNYFASYREGPEED